MATASSPFLPVPIDQFVDGTPADREHWLALIAASLSAEALNELERQAMADIDVRYPDDPGSLINRRYLQGKWRKQEVRADFDRAHQQLHTQRLGQVEAIRAQSLNHLDEMVRGLFYEERRPAERRRRQDHLADVVATGLAHDQDYQRAEAEAEAAHRRELGTDRITAKLERRRLKAVATIEKARRKLDQPHELQLKLYAVLEALAKYQMSLQDRAARNPALADRLRMLGLGLTSVMTSVQTLIDDLNRQGDEQPTSDELRAQSDRILTMAMEQLTQWQVQTQQEPL